MMKPLLALLAISALFGGTSLFAQSTGESSLASVREAFAGRTEYRIDERPHELVFRDAASGAEVFTLSETTTGTLTLSGSVQGLNGTMAVTPSTLDERISWFNCSSAVGTMWIDQRTGAVTMLHHLNPQLVSRNGLANVADRFGEAVRSETRTLTQK